MKKIFVIAGEPSGDLHASNLVKEMKHSILLLRLKVGEEN